MKIKQVEKLFVGKLAMHTNENRRHRQYTLSCESGNDIPLLTTLCVSRGSKELSKNNLAGLSDVMGMNLREFERASKCNIGPACCLLGMAVCVLSKAKIEIENDPITNNWDSTLLLYVPLLLSEASIREDGKKRSDDSAFLEKLRKKIVWLSSDAQGKFKTLLVKCEEVMDLLP